LQTATVVAVLSHKLLCFTLQQLTCVAQDIDSAAVPIVLSE